MRKTVWALPALTLCSIIPALGQQLSLAFDAAATKINWTLSGNVHTTHGTFRLKEGHVTVNVANGHISGELVVEAESGESGNASRDKRMKKEVLETDKYPQIRFQVTGLEGAAPLKSESSVRVVGQMSIHGASHEVTIPLQITLNGTEFSGHGKLAVPYVDWGMKDPSNFLFKVAKTVEVEFVAVGLLQHEP